MTLADTNADAAPLGPGDFGELFADLTDGPILAAVSGGPDSTAMMHALAYWAAQPGRPPILVATVDHGIRSESRAEAQAVAATARELGLRHQILTWGERKAGPVSQQQARRARYALLVACAHDHGAPILVTAHTLDDQAETLLIRMAAGSGLSGLAGMHRIVMRDRVRHVRPLLSIAKARLTATCRAHGWSFVEDPSNAASQYARARWRSLLPGLAAEGLDAARLTRLAGRLQRADVALDALAAEAYGRIRLPASDGRLELQGAEFSRQPAEIALRVLELALRDAAAAQAASSAPPPIRLERLEACLEALLQGFADGRRERRTLAGCQITLSRKGEIAIAPEPDRRRGRREVTEIAAGTPHSLGIAGMRA
jgi:tRNA(Ile)-lysidine synthase